jgi:hypothetical protein
MTEVKRTVHATITTAVGDLTRAHSASVDVFDSDQETWEGTLCLLFDQLREQEARGIPAGSLYSHDEPLPGPATPEVIAAVRRVAENGQPPSPEMQELLALIGIEVKS